MALFLRLTKPHQRSFARSFTLYQNQEKFVFPRESEGNTYPVNWSLNFDGVVPQGNAFRNARPALLMSHLATKPSNGIVNANDSLFSGSFQINEAGDSITQEQTADLLLQQHHYFSSGIDLFVEDHSLGAHFDNRVGVRVVTDDSMVAIALRALLIPTPPRCVNHHGRFHGWNLTRSEDSLLPSWDGKQFHSNPSTPLPGQRPIVVFIGGPSTEAVVQFVQDNGTLLGANISIGARLPLKATIKALDLAVNVFLNAQDSEGLALSSLTLKNGKETCVVVGADESFLSSHSSSLYGAYSNYLTSMGVSALWNGAILKSPSSTLSSDLPLVSGQGDSCVPLHPDNMAFPASSILFYEKGSAKAPLTEEEAVSRLVALTGPKKESVARSLVKGIKLGTIGSPSDL